MTDTHSVRLHGDEIDFGHLDGLAGNWHGANGFNLIAVPDQKGDFELLIDPYTEDLVVTKVPATTPNRGLTVIENIPTLQYATTISETADSKNSLMHVEGGFWELSTQPGRNAGFDIFRIASVPHGNAVEAMGNSSVCEGPPDFEAHFSALPTGDLPILSGYTDKYIGEPLYPDFSPLFPTRTLSNYLQKQIDSGLKVTKTVTLQVSTRNKGGISNIASIRTNANATEFDAIFWIETLEDSDGHVFRQLQYVQRIMIEFPIKADLPGQTIAWPHVNVNTLTTIT
ncbi:MAG TPA: heme-binding protein [Allosphingosinicella sp.]|nr:heme-binding protein [Allosphingosinicella sp.]